MSGLELLPKAKAARPDVPDDHITAYGDADTRRKALEGGAEALLTKPIDFVALRTEIDMRVERAALTPRILLRCLSPVKAHLYGPASSSRDLQRS